MVVVLVVVVLAAVAAVNCLADPQVMHFVNIP